MRDMLAEFKDWWLESRPLKIPFDNLVGMDARVCTAVIYRSPPWQVQLIIFAPNIVVPEHKHPNVDSFEVYLSGDIEFTLEGKVLTTIADGEFADFAGLHPKMGESIRVLPSSWHGGKSGPKGGLFLSIQCWLNGVKPTDVGSDWVHRDGEERKNYGGEKS